MVSKNMRGGLRKMCLFWLPLSLATETDPLCGCSNVEDEEDAAEVIEMDPKLAKKAAKAAKEAAKLAKEAAKLAEKLAVQCPLCQEPAKLSWLECASCTARTHVTCLASHFIEVTIPLHSILADHRDQSI